MFTEGLPQKVQERLECLLKDLFVPTAVALASRKFVCGPLFACSSGPTLVVVGPPVLAFVVDAVSGHPLLC